MRNVVSMCIAACLGIVVGVAAEEKGGEDGKAAPARSLFLIKQGSKYGYMDRAGKVVIAPRYDMALDFSEGLAAVCVGSPLRKGPPQDHSPALPEGRWGYIDEKGTVVIQPRFVHAEPFASGVARVSEKALAGKEEAGFIDRRGKALSFTALRSFSEGLAPTVVQVKLKGQEDGRGKGRRAGETAVERYRFIDPRGVEVFATELDPRFSLVGDFSEGLVRFSTRGSGAPGGERLWGYMDRKGKVVVPAKYMDARDFHAGLAAVKPVLFDGEGKPQPRPPGGWLWGYIDTSGKLVIPPTFLAAGDFSEGLAAVQVQSEGKSLHWEWIDRTGRKQFAVGNASAPGEFRDGLARIGPAGFINAKGKLAIECHGKASLDFDGGLARLVSRDSKAWAYIDTKGRTVWTEDADAFGMGRPGGGSSADARRGGRLWGLRVTFAGGDGNWTGTEVHIYEGTPKPPEKQDSYVFDPSAHKLVTARTTGSFGECSFADLPTPFFVYIQRPGFKPEWRWYDSTRQWYAISLTPESSKLRTRPKDQAIDPFPPPDGGTMPQGTEFTPKRP